MPSASTAIIGRELRMASRRPMDALGALLRARPEVRSWAELLFAARRAHAQQSAAPVVAGTAR